MQLIHEHSPNIIHACQKNLFKNGHNPLTFLQLDKSTVNTLRSQFYAQ